MLFTSRYSNPMLRSGNYMTVRISLGIPKWDLGYQINGEMTDLMPFGLLNKFDTQEEFEPAYFARLDSKGTDRIKRQLEAFAESGKDVVLLCYEDIRKGPDNWCHRRSFAKWWKMKTGQDIQELYDPTGQAHQGRRQESSKPNQEPSPSFPTGEQLTLF